MFYVDQRQSKYQNPKFYAEQNTDKIRHDTHMRMS